MTPRCMGQLEEFLIDPTSVVSGNQIRLDVVMIFTSLKVGPVNVLFLPILTYYMEKKYD